jgi:predicted permease
MKRLIALFRNLFHRDRVNRELTEEVGTAFALLVKEKERSGLDSASARRAAAIEFGRVEPVVDAIHDVKAGALVAAWALDFRHAFRLLRRSPLFTAFAVASLALGIGAAGAIFQLFDAIVLRQLPVPEPGQMVVASFGGVNGRFNYSMPYPHFDEIRRRTTTLSGIFATNPFGQVNVTYGDDAAIAEGTYVSGDYYATLRLTPALGRLLDANDDRPGVEVAVLSHRYWQRRFAGRGDVIGASIALNGIPFTIVGVEPEGFEGTEVGRPYDLSVPMRARDRLDEGGPLWNEAFAAWIYMMGRMKPGVTLAEAERELKTIFAQVSTAASTSPAQLELARQNQLRLQSGARGASSDLREQYERWLRLLLAMLGAVLLLACLNVATLLLSRSDARQRELSTRLALGAGRWRIVRQLLTETVVLAGIAGAVGFAVATWGGRTLLALVRPSVERPPIELTSDWRLAVFTLSVAFLVCLIAGLIPALRATNPARLAPSRQVGGGRQRRLLDRCLVAAQVGLSLTLLVAAGLFVRTLQNLWSQDPGYSRENVLMFSVDARLAGRTGPAVPATYRAVLDSLKTLPGAQAATVSAVRPVSDSYYFISSYTEIGNKLLPREQRVRVAYNNVAPGYFSTLGIRLVAGRDFDDRDRPETAKVAIISERMARHFDGSPLSQRLGSGPGAREVVGVVADVRYANVRDLPREVVYFPIFQQQGRDMFYSPTFEIRFAGAMPGVLASVREAVGRVDPALTLFRIRTLERQTEDSFARERLLAVLASYFGGFAVLLACIGLYGLMSYSITLRTPEIGLRMALGATPGSVRLLAVRESTWTVLAGAVAGTAGAYAAVRILESQLFGVQPHDPAVFAGATVLLLILTVAAAFFPARRASRIDPLVALRHE